MDQTNETPVVPKQYGGKWIAWNFERTRIVACGATLAEAKRAAESLGEPRPILAKVPRADVWFIGGKR